MAPAASSGPSWPSQGNQRAGGVQCRLGDPHLVVAAAHLDGGARLVDGLREPCLDVAEHDTVGRDVVATPLLCEGARDADLRRLPGAVGDLRGGAVETRHRGDVHHLATHRAPLGFSLALRSGANVRCRGAQQPEGRRGVNLEHLLPLRVHGVLDGGVPDVAGVVDQDVEIAETLQGGAHDGVSEVRGRHVARVDQRRAPGLFDGAGGLLSRAGVEIVDHHRGALPGELARRGGPHAPPGPGDDGDPALQATLGMAVAHESSASMRSIVRRAGPFAEIA